MQMVAGKSFQNIENLLQKVRFLRGHLRWVIFWPLAALLFLILGWTLLLNDLNTDRQRLEQTARSNVIDLAKNYAGNLARTLETVDQTILHVRYEWELSKGTLQLETINQKKLFHAGSIFQVAITNSDGYVRTSTLANPSSMYLGQDRFFLVQKYAIIDFLYMGQPKTGRLSNENVLYFSRGVSKPDGSFDGVVVVSTASHYFTSTYNQSSLGKNGLLALVGDDYTVRATRVGNKVGSVGAFAFAQTPYFPTLSGSHLFNGRTWFADQRNRYIGWQQLEGFPLVAVAGLDQADVLAPYWTTRETSIRNAVLATLALIGFALIAMFLSARLAWRKHQLERTQATYRMATEEGNEGFYIIKPILDRSRKISDFETVDCNSYGARLFQQRRDAVLGKRFSGLFPEPERRNLMSYLAQAMETGFYEGEMESSSSQPGAAKWLYLKMVRSDGELAITMRDISDSKAHVSELERRGNEDALTGLPNRHWIQTYLPQALERANGEQAMLALLFVDLDGFKSINDTMGHLVGDELLCYAAERLKVAVRPNDYVVRLGGDEFVVIVEQLAERLDAAHVAERIVAAFKEKFRLSQGIHTIGTSIGISVYPTDGKDAATLLQNADIAMYSVKTTGKGNYRFFEHRFYEVLRSRLDREHELRHAIENDEFVMHYQPRIDMQSGAVSSMEALVRWKHPTKGLLEPIEFIALAEETGLILGIGDLVIDKVCAQLAAWSRQGRTVLPVSVNVSPRQFNQGNFTKTIAVCLKRYQLASDLLEIEITESCMMGDSGDVANSLATLRSMGIKFLIDDFGTGYSSLSQLQRLDFDVLKVDRAFTSEVEKNEEGKVFFTAIITMAHALGMRVVAEGVENERQIKILKFLRCDEIQGFYVARPSPAGDRQTDFSSRPVPALA